MDGEEVGFVYSQRASSRTTLWGRSRTLDERLFAGAPLRPLALEALAEESGK